MEFIFSLVAQVGPEYLPTYFLFVFVAPNCTHNRVL